MSTSGTCEVSSPVPATPACWLAQLYVRRRLLELEAVAEDEDKQRAKARDLAGLIGKLIGPPVTSSDDGSVAPPGAY